MDTPFPVFLALTVSILCIIVGAYCLRLGLTQGLWSRPAWRATSRIWMAAVALWCAVLAWTVLR